MKLIKIWVMVSEPHATSTQSFTGIDIEHAVKQLHDYLDANTQPGTRAEIIQCGYINEGEQYGV